MWWIDTDQESIVVSHTLPVPKCIVIASYDVSIYVFS